MNYIEINENHPMAWEALMGWLREKQPDRTFVLEETGELKYLRNLTVEYFNIRDLYDFFDEKGIPISMSKMTRGNFLATVGEGVNVWSRAYDTRREAETAAFAKAFEILGGRLND